MRVSFTEKKSLIQKQKRKIILPDFSIFCLKNLFREIFFLIVKQIQVKIEQKKKRNQQKQIKQKRNLTLKKNLFNQFIFFKMLILREK